MQKYESTKESPKEPATFKPSQHLTDQDEFFYSPRSQYQQPIQSSIPPPIQYSVYQQPPYQTPAQPIQYAMQPQYIGYENQFTQSFQTSNIQLAPEVYIHYEPVETKYIEYQTIKKKIQVPINEEIIEYVPVTTEIPKQVVPPIYSQNIARFPQVQKQVPNIYRQSRSGFQGRKPYENIF